MAKRMFPDKELSAKAIKALMDARCLPSGPQQLDALKKAAQLRDAANSYHQLFSAEFAGPADHARS
ncbi:hypothetical protein JQ609_30965 [Bradyrhizobium sp. AUGA SZCCT0169]|jgi:hypothetical protein|uniref:hypothetical protein n=1 Tax=Bradyrhizobium sp. AUGA SZCCT0169 TaxID=2807663 RepID=UPI001BAC4D90|nr:hypothetical protein [Bradyrhizobium sp. AUGA SZCCT0169]MBR1251328.1 hypothetical protein [Bradyrhizobium sp. AUGA SZCCT0169]